MKSPYDKKGSGDQRATGKPSGGKQKGMKCVRCGLKGHNADNCQVRCFQCSKIGHTKKNCRQKQNVHNIEQEDSVEYEFGVDQSCMNVLDNELYDECNRVETSIGNGNPNACVCLCGDSSHVSNMCSCSCFKYAELKFSNDLHVNSANIANNDLISADCANYSAIKSADYADIETVKSADLANLNADNSLLKSTFNSYVEDSVVPKSAVNVLNDNILPCVRNDQVCSCINVIDLSKPCIEVKFNGKVLHMEFDSGSAVSVVSKRTLLSCGLSNLTLEPSRKTLRVAS